MEVALQRCFFCQKIDSDLDCQSTKCDGFDNNNAITKKKFVLVSKKALVTTKIDLYIFHWSTPTAWVARRQCEWRLNLVMGRTSAPLFYLLAEHNSPLSEGRPLSYNKQKWATDTPPQSMALPQRTMGGLSRRAGCDECAQTQSHRVWTPSRWPFVCTRPSPSTVIRSIRRWSMLQGLTESLATPFARWRMPTTFRTWSWRRDPTSTCSAGVTADNVVGGVCRCILTVDFVSWSGSGGHCWRTTCTSPPTRRPSCNQADTNQDGSACPSWLSDAEYTRWSGGDGRPLLHVDDDDALLLTSTRPSPVTPLFPLLECHRRLCGDVGLLWTVPLLYCMLRDRLRWLQSDPVVREFQVACPSSILPNSAHGALCPRLPAGCHVYFHRWPAGTWTRYQPLVEHWMRSLCQRLAGEAPVGSTQRRFGPREDFYFPLSPSMDDLHVCVVGGVPLGVAGTHQTPDGGHQGTSPLYVSSLCAATGSGCGPLMLQHLQRHVAAVGQAIVADAIGSSAVVAMYQRCGFVPVVVDPEAENVHDDGTTMVWTDNRSSPVPQG